MDAMNKCHSILIVLSVMRNIFAKVGDFHQTANSLTAFYQSHGYLLRGDASFPDIIGIVMIEQRPSMKLYLLEKRKKHLSPS